MVKKNTCVSLYTSERTAEQAIEELRAQKFNLKTVSMVGHTFDNDGDSAGLYTSNKQAYFFGLQAAFWNRILRQLGDVSFLLLADLGLLVASGFIVSLLVKKQKNIEAINKLNLLAAVFFSLGIPLENIRQYQKALKDKKFLLIVHAPRPEIECACHILHSATQQVAVHMA